MATLQQQLQFLLEGGRVQRFHTRPGIKPDTDAQHSHGVAVIFYLLCGLNGTPLTWQSLMGCLCHDLGEQGVSDVSTHTKNALDIRAQLSKLENDQLVKFEFNFELTDAEQRTMHLADQLEGMLNACYERSLGNTNASLIFSRYHNYVVHSGISQKELPLLTAIENIWKEASSERGFSFDSIS